MTNQTGTKTPKKINDKLVKMVALSMGFEDMMYDTFTPTERKAWDKLAKAIDTTCETIQKHFNGKDYLQIKD